MLTFIRETLYLSLVCFSNLGIRFDLCVLWAYANVSSTVATTGFLLVFVLIFLGMNLKLVKGSALRAMRVKTSSPPHPPKGRAQEVSGQVSYHCASSLIWRFETALVPIMSSCDEMTCWELD